MGKNKNGFTLAELLIVVAIISVLVAVAIPVFSNQLEKSRRAVDMHTARSIASVLTTAVNDGTVVMGSQNDCGICVAIWYDNKRPQYYPNVSGKTYFCGANKGVTMKDKSANSNISVTPLGSTNIEKEMGITSQVAILCSNHVQMWCQGCQIFSRGIIFILGVSVQL